jgi:ABC-type dipeptide/oligopeptide/nickel transport system permease subunit
MQGIDSTRFSVFIGKGSLTLPVRNQTLSSFNVGRSFTAILDSRDSAVDELFGSSSIDPAQIIFFEPGQYSYGFKIFIPDSNQANGVSFKLFFNNLNISMLGTSWGLLGTDQYGRDIFTQLAWGARISLLVGLVASILGIIVGLAVGLLAGYLGKLIDEVLMRLTDLVLVLPGLPLLIVLAATIGPSIWNIILVLGFLGWAGFARIVRSQVLSLRERPFIEASKAAGSGTTHIIGRHILPNVLGLTYVSLALAVPTAIVSEAALAFLGLRDPTIVSWGGMLNDVQGFNGITLWWWVLPPGLSIALLSLSFILLGYALDEILNPRLRMRR